MVRVKLLVARATETEAQRPGDVIYVQEDVAQRMIEDKQAVPVAMQVRTTMIDTRKTTETRAALPPMPKRKRGRPRKHT